MKNLTKWLVLTVALLMVTLMLGACDGEDTTTVGGMQDLPEKKTSEGLAYRLDEDGKGYSVVGIGVCKDTNLVIPATHEGLPVTGIEEFAFEDCKSITGVVISDGVMSIGGAAFFGCKNLISITFSSSVTYIGITALGDCDSLTSISVESGNPVYHSTGNCVIETASKTLIAGCKSSVIPLDGSVTSIFEDAFRECKGLTSITIPNGVTSIGISAFDGCKDLTNIALPNSLTSIASCGFYNCHSIETITIPISVANIGEQAFYLCESLTAIYYCGSASEWSEISIGGGNSDLTSATIYYYSEVAPTEAGNYWRYVDGVPTAW